MARRSYNPYPSYDPYDPHGVGGVTRAYTSSTVAERHQIGVLRRVLQRADRVVTGRPVEIKLEEYGPAPAWSDGETITFNLDEIKPEDLHELIQIHGLNFHEVSHVLYTPRAGSELHRWTRERGYFNTFNILEDQRIETLFVARFPAVAKYLTATVTRWILDDPEVDPTTLHTLLRGRRYLPVEVRDAVEAAYAQPEYVPAINAIIDRYRTLAFPADFDMAKTLIEAMHKILSYLPQPPQTGCGSADKTKKGRPAPQADQRQAADKAKRGEGEAQPKDADKADSKDADKSDKDKGEPEKGQKSEGEGEGQKSDQSAEGDKSEGDQPGGEDAKTQQGDKSEGDKSEGDKSEGDPGPDSDSAGGNGAGEGGDDVNPIDRVRDEARKALDDVQSDSEVLTEMERKRQIVREGDGQYENSIPQGRFGSVDVPQPVKVDERKFREVLRQLIEACDPGWEREVPSGRLNVSRVMRGCDPSEAFDRWAEGDDGYDLEVAVLIDMSGSMSGEARSASKSPMQAAAETAWLIDRAVKGVGGDCTSFVFSGRSATLYGKDAKPQQNTMLMPWAGGGTEPLLCIEEAERMMMASRRANKLVIIVTDGVWSADSLCDEALRRIEALGSMTACAFIYDEDFNGATPQEVRAKFGHGMQVFGHIKSTSDLPTWGKAVVGQAIKRRRR